MVLFLFNNKKKSGQPKPDLIHEIRIGGKKMNESFTMLKPSIEQKQFINHAKQGENILVDACIGSGKTTAIQKLCMSLPSNKRILYLTYNKLLKLDAQSKIRNPNVLVQNYHGFAYMINRQAGLYSGVSDLIQTTLQNKPPVPQYDLLILDEYQDIDLEISQLLEYIKSMNPNLQIIAVGDMEQKIYDKTTLDVSEFIPNFLDEHTTLEFTQCFRLSSDLASTLGRIWNKDIKGVNPNCIVESMSQHKVVEFLAQSNTEDIMCLGARTGVMSNVLNTLEMTHPEKFNKHTVYASISDHVGTVSPTPTSAIFTTFDSSKGMERKICVVFDYDIAYWSIRLRKPQQKYNILRNIFLVAASRGKDHIIFVKGNNDILDEKILSTVPKQQAAISDMSMSSLFAFKYHEDVDKAYSLITVKQIADKDNDYKIIDIPTADGLIDLSPCISIYQLTSYFNQYNIDRDLELLNQQKYKRSLPDYQRNLTLDKKVLLLTSLLTNQRRYQKQVSLPFISSENLTLLHNRIATRLSHNERVQVYSNIVFQPTNGKPFEAQGYADVIKDDVLYELFYGDEISHELFLECACNMIGTQTQKGVVWNIRDNTIYSVTINDEEKFINSVLKTATKGLYTRQKQ